ncbi:response regulator [Paracoccus limosus]|uniref:histidine kinase n=1 Tax=Paracoccus limosus TaxID=913252 RepID=A0A844H430_9RHOB|nr:response regulator [Paracoccus limosus]
MSLSVQFALVMLSFVLLVGGVSWVGYQGASALSRAQDRVRVLGDAMGVIEQAESAFLAREIALIRALATDTPQARSQFVQANRSASEALDRLTALPAPDAQTLADAAAIHTASQEWVQEVALPFLARNATVKDDTGHARLLAEYMAQTLTGPLAQIAPESFARLRSTAVRRTLDSRSQRDAALAWIHDSNGITAAVVMLAALMAFAVLHHRISRPISRLALAMARLARDDRTVDIPYQDRSDEIGAMGRALLIFRNLAVARAEDLDVKGALTRLSDMVQAQDSLRDFGHTALTAMAQELGAEVAVFFSYDPEQHRLWLFSAYGYRLSEDMPKSYAMGEGLIGQVARDRKLRVLSPVPENYLRLQSGTGHGAPQMILLTPVLLRDRLIGVMEFALMAPMNATRQRILDEAIHAVSLPLENLERALETRALLAQSRRQTEELQAAEEELRAQQEALQATNDELACRTSQLEASQKEAITRAEELQRTSQYKSRFLANMSHELRTPLNSMLILAQDLASNSERNLQPDQVEAAQVIHTSGISLLRLINEILDLSKIEAGKIEVRREPLALRQLVLTLEHSFRPIAEQKRVDFRITCALGLPELILTDPGRLEQIANNLIGNALKFTAQGGVQVTLAPEGGDRLALIVRDSGIGIPTEKLTAIFQPFEQVDDSTHRQYGGTGLGLTISRQLAVLMGGTLEVDSVLGQGSVFRLVIPIGAGAGLPAASVPAPLPLPAPAAAVRREGVGRSVLVVEDDGGTQKAVSHLMARAGIEVTGALTAEEALALLRSQRFDCLILDIGLPDLSGFEFLDRLAGLGCSVPVVVYSARDIQPDELLRLRGHTDSIVLKGEHSERRLLDEVSAFLHPAQAAPASPAPAPAAAPADTAPLQCKLLLVDDDMRNIYALAKVLRARGCEVVLAQDGLKALAELEAHPDVQIVLMDMMMPNMDGYEAMREIRARGGDWRDLPIIALTAKAMKEDRDRCIEAGASDYMTKPIDTPQLLAKIREQLQHGK